MTSRKPFNSNKDQQPKKTTSSVAKKIAPPEEISYNIAHAIPGRIRFRIPRLVKDAEYANKLKQVIECHTRITNVRVNPTAASIIVSYQPGVISDNQMR